MKLLSSQGQGTYDSSLGVWSIGNLQVGGIATLELVLQAVDAGYFVNVVSVNGDLPVTKSISSTSTGVVRFWSAGASSGMYDPNLGNNGANYGVNSLNPANIPDNLNKYPYNFPDNIVPPTPDTPPTPPQKPDDQNTPDLGPLTHDSQSSRDINWIRNNIGDGNLKEPLPEWNLNRDNESKKDNGIPIWVYIMAILGLITAILAYKYSSALSEYLMAVWTSILNALTVLWFYLSYLGVSLKDLIVTGYRLFSQYGGYIAAAINELWSTPITGVGSTTLIGLGLRFLAEKYPVLAPIVAPFIYALEQLTYAEIAKKFNELFNKES